MDRVSYADISIVSCGTMSLELNYLKMEGLLDTPQILFTTPGLHQDIPDLERQLVHQIQKAKEKTPKVVVVYGGKYCYVNPEEPTRLMKTIIEEQGPGVTRIEATHCMDMIAGEDQRETIAQEVAGGEPVWWMFSSCRVPEYLDRVTRIIRGWSGLIFDRKLSAVLLMLKDKIKPFLCWQAVLVDGMPPQ
jgi:hypothetical protein